MSKVVLRGFIVVPESDLQAVEDELPNHIRRTRAEPGCLSFAVDRSPDDPCRFTVFEEFDDSSAFELHQQRVQESYWGKVTANVERHYQSSDE